MIRKRIGIVAKKLDHSLSPLIHNYWLEKYKIDGKYEAIQAYDEVDFENIVDRLIEEEYAGFNVTVPFKEKAYKMVHELVNDRTSICNTNIGSVNTVKIQNRKLHGYNTDIYGFIAGLGLGSVDFDLDAKVLVLGAGGSSRSVLFGLMTNDIINNEYDEPSFQFLEVLTRKESTMRAYKLLSDLSKTPSLTSANIPIINEIDRLDIQSMSFATERWPEYSKFKSNPLAFANFDYKVDELTKSNIQNGIENCDLLINCTPLGMSGADFDLDISLDGCKDTLVVYDLVYSPLETPLIKEAKKHKLKTINGLEMLLYQAAAAFEVFYGAQIPDDWKQEFEAIDLLEDLTTPYLVNNDLYKIIKKDIQKNND